MDERRRSTRDPTYLPGVIYFNHGRNSLSCVVRDYSYEGARIVIFDPINVPNEVELHIPERNRLVHATVRWRHGNKIGLAFSRQWQGTIRRTPARSTVSGADPRPGLNPSATLCGSGAIFAAIRRALSRVRVFTSVPCRHAPDGRAAHASSSPPHRFCLSFA